MKQYFTATQDYAPYLTKDKKYFITRITNAGIYCFIADRGKEESINLDSITGQCTYGRLNKIGKLNNNISIL